MDAGVNLSLKIPATVDAQCSCFCFKAPPVPVVVLRNNTLHAVEKAHKDDTAAAVQAVADEVIRRCHPDFGRAERVLNRAGVNLQSPPGHLTVEQVADIQRALGVHTPNVEREIEQADTRTAPQ